MSLSFPSPSPLFFLATRALEQLKKEEKMAEKNKQTNKKQNVTYEKLTKAGDFLVLDLSKNYACNEDKKL